MNKGVWKGQNLISKPKVLLLGESHYDEENYGETVSFPTYSVVNHYFEKREKWSPFFDKIAASFGYSIENARDFYEKVYFGNYIDVVCGVGDDNAENYIEQNRIKYNTDLFNFINSEGIDIVVCFSKLVYNNLPSLSNSTNQEHNQQVCIGQIGSRGNYVEYCNYLPNITHPNCQTTLNKALKVYGIRHPSSKGGFSVEQVYSFLQSQQDLAPLCINAETSEPVETVEVVEVLPRQEQAPIPVVRYEEVNTKSQEVTHQNNGQSYLITPEVDSQFTLRILAPMAVTLILFCMGLFTQQYLIFLFDLIPLVFSIRGINANKNRCPNCRGWNPWLISNQRLVKEDRVRVRRPLGSMYIHSGGRTTYGIRQTFVSAEEKTYENQLKCRFCGFETKSYVTNIDDKIR